ncbi:MAG TPA: cellulase family glycosylhydrolase [Caulobacteraceae bacterium]|nr:cellulase family glycosylhydrolase [Caulobacteraceae bacterium]
MVVAGLYFISEKHAVAARLDKPVSALTVSGNQILSDGAPFLARGYIFENLAVTRAELRRCAAIEYCSMRLQARDFLFGEGAFASNSGLDVARAWGANTVRFNLEQVALDPASPGYSPEYVNEVQRAVKLARARGLAVILALFDQRNRHAPDALRDTNPKTPLSNEVTLRAAEALARTYGQDRGVMLELLNEPWSPMRTDIGWRIWRDGGSPDTGAYAGVEFVGVNPLIRAIRAQGARNVIVVQGLSFSMKGYPGGVQDPLGQLVFSVHPFFGDGRPAFMDWDGAFGRFAASHPVLLTAWNTLPGQTWCQTYGLDTPAKFLDYVRAHHVGMIAFAMDVPWTVVRDFRQTPIEPTTYGEGCPQRGGPGAMIRQYFLSQP